MYTRAHRRFLLLFKVDGVLVAYSMCGWILLRIYKYDDNMLYDMEREREHKGNE